MKESLPDMRTLRLAPSVIEVLREHAAEVAGETIRAITAEVPAYAEAFAGEYGGKISNAVREAIGTLLDLVSPGSTAEVSSQLAPALAAAYELGRGEARSGRSLDALLAAYRIGARVAWRELAQLGVGAGESAQTIAVFAEVVFAYIDQLSAASAAGHATELDTSGRMRVRRLERLAQALIAGEPGQTIVAAADRADWRPPQTLTAVLLSEGSARATIGLLDSRTLQLADTLPELPETSVLLVPDAHGASRGHLVRLLAGHAAIVGPARPWLSVRSSVERAVRTSRFIGHQDDGAVVDTEEHLVELVVTADPQALADLRARVLAPLAAEREPAAAKLTETLLSWLLHQGSREKVAADLYVHPQTVRYRMARLRELYGDRLRDPRWVLSLAVALAVPAAPDQLNRS